MHQHALRPTPPEETASARARAHRILEVAAADDATSRAFDVSLMCLIVANLVAAILETVPSLHAEYRRGFELFELASVAVFSLEYAARVWSCTVVPKYGHPVTGRLRFMATPMSLVDLAAILPFYLPFLGFDLRQLRVLRLFRLLRAAKFARYSHSLQLILRVAVKRRGELAGTGALMLMLLVCASTLLYFAEREAQPDAFSSIPAAMWWAITTLTTVGYGDVTPVTTLGRSFAALVAILGIGLFALPTGVLGAAFVEEMRHEAPQRCPHCGKRIDPPGS
jgi:voltage-gated potassium channel